MRQINKYRPVFTVVLILWCVFFSVIAFGQDRFPKPDFETDYTQPLTTTPPPRSPVMAVIDVAALILALSLTSYFALRRRSRRAIWLTMVGSLIYFGFIRHGCVCTVGSMQNIVLGLVDAGYFVPLGIVAFFVIPLVFALFFGRTFCASVCPLGAVQDITIVKPVKVSPWINEMLGLIPHIVLGLAILFAATGSAFILCQYDPYVTLFRLDGDLVLIILTAIFLIAGLFIARPYCRFFCPYGVLLGWMSRLSRRHVTITPDECVDCRLCEESCPFDAIERPTPDKAPETRQQGIRRLALLIPLIPVVMFASGWIFSSADTLLARVHPRVRLARRIQIEEAGLVRSTTLESRTFRSQGETTEMLMAETQEITSRFRTGGWILGAYLGLIFGLKLITLSVRRKRTDWEPHKGNCVSCGRCFKYCPVHQAKDLPEAKGEQSGNAT